MARSGAHALGLLAIPLNSQILHSLATGPKRQVELRRESGSPALSTLRSHLKELERIEAIVKHRRNAFPGSLEYELGGPGKELLFVMNTLERWLGRAPEGALELGSDPAKAAIKALVEGWSSTMVRALAAHPFSLTELDSLIAALNYPSLERRLGAMRLAGLVEALPSDGRGTPHAVTDWLRLGIGPIAAASRWERRNVPDQTARIGRVDAEAGLMLAMPLLRLPAELSGSCRMVVELSNGSEGKSAAVTVAAEDGRVFSCVAGRNGADAWMTGPVDAWFRAAIEADPGHLELGGDRRLACALLANLYDVLFDPRILIRSEYSADHLELGT